MDFTDVKNVTEGREGGKGTRLGFLCGLIVIIITFAINVMYFMSIYN